MSVYAPALRMKLRLHPPDVGELFCVAQNLLKKGDLEEAYTTFSSASSKAPWSPILQRMLSSTACKLGRFKDAIQHGELAISVSK